MEKTMSLGLVGRKVGMTRIFTPEGDSIPVTVLDVSDNRVTQIKSVETDGYIAVQVAFGTRRASRVTKPLAGHLAKAGVQSGEVLKEFQIDSAKAAELSNGTVIGTDIFEVGQKVDVQACRSVRATPVPSSVTTSLRVAHRTVTRVRTTSLVRSVWRRIRVVFSRVSA